MAVNTASVCVDIYSFVFPVNVLLVLFYGLFCYVSYVYVRSLPPRRGYIGGNMLARSGVVALLVLELLFDCLLGTWSLFLLSFPSLSVTGVSLVVLFQWSQSFNCVDVLF
ncbi:hypothetical protein LZ32DRAFT_673250, partial [Colletotrichum eremochloae]